MNLLNTKRVCIIGLYIFMSDSMGSMVVSGDLLAGRALFGTRGAHPCKWDG